VVEFLQLGWMEEEFLALAIAPGSAPLFWQDFTLERGGSPNRLVSSSITSWPTAT